MKSFKTQMMAERTGQSGRKAQFHMILLSVLVVIKSNRSYSTVIVFIRAIHAILDP